jgi:serine phosphatase RsbU (regulator of sigma subunit)/anti-sigma regulatory factor (Ser/Thr protein kinase)
VPSVSTAPSSDTTEIGRLLAAVGPGLLMGPQPAGTLAVVVLDGRSRVVVATARLGAVTGLDQDDHLGLPWGDVVPELADAQRTRPGHPGSGTFVRPGADGPRTWQARWFPLRDGTGVLGAVVLVHDITATLAERHSEVLRRHAADLMRAPSPADVAAATVTALRDAFAPQGCAVGLVEGSELARLVLDDKTGGPGETGARWRRTPLEAASPMHEAIRERRRVEVHGREGRAERWTPEAVARMAPFASLIYVPVGDRLGGLGVAFGAAHELSPADGELLAAIADQCAQALQRARLHERAEQGRRRAEAMQELASLLAAATTSDEIADLIAENVHAVVDAQYTQLGLLDVEAEVLSLHHGAALGPDARQEWQQVPLSAPIPVTEVARSGRPAFFPDRAALVAAFPLVEQAAEESGYETVAVVPVPLPDGRTAGTLSAAWSAPSAVGGEALAVLADIAQRCGVVLMRGDEASRQARMHERTQLMARVLAELEETRSAAERMARLVALLVPEIADYAIVEDPGPPRRLCAVTHRDPEMVHVLRELRDRHALAPDAPNSAQRAAVGESQLIARITPALIAEYTLAPEAIDLLNRLGPRSHINVPLVAGGTVLMLGTTDPERRTFTQDDLAFIEELAARAGLVIGTAQLLDREHATAVRLQRALLPTQPIEHPRLQMAARYLPGDGSLQIGGDWHETLVLPDGRVVVGVGDIVGHGLEAAATMGQVRTAFTALAPRSTGPADLITQLSTFTATIPSAIYSSLACAMIDPDGAVLTYSCAGHPPPVLVGPGGAATILRGGRSWLLGCGVARDRAEAAAPFPAGSTLLLYSDGLVERRREPLDVGLDRLRAVAEQTAGLAVDAQADAMITALTGEGPRADDVVLLTVRLTPGAGMLRIRLDADPAQLAPVRRQLRAWMSENGVRSADQDTLLLATGEALGNAVEHAYVDAAAGVVELTAALDAERRRFTVTICDHGRWRAFHGDTGRGRGTAIMRALSASFDRNSDETGTTVTMEFVPTEATT